MRKARLLLLTATALMAPALALAEPTGGALVAGSATIGPEIGQTTTIDQFSSAAIINWASFNIAGNERVVFNQPSATAVLLNRVLGGGPSLIDGQIDADGRIVIINGDGVIFGAGATIDVGGILATSMNIADADFMAGNYLFSTPGAVGAAITNFGSITAATAGMIAFVAPNVANHGLLRANLGTIHLASGEAFTFDFFGDGLVAFAASSATSGTKTGVVANFGDIDAAGGAIYMTATDARDFVETVINVESDLVARTATMIGGKIVLAGGDQSEVNVDAVLDASGAGGGQISVSGGVVRIAPGAALLADSLVGNGDGGVIAVASTRRTEFEGLASVQPGASSGQGGSITLGSDGILVYSGTVRLGAPPREGTLTLNTVTIPPGGGTGGGGSGGGGGGGGPVLVPSPVIADTAAARLSEIAATLPRDPAAAGAGPGVDFVLTLDGTEILGGASGQAPGKTGEAQLMCLHGVAAAACGEDGGE